MHSIVWEFRVPTDHVAEFEEAYGPRGQWAVLFAQAEGFLGVELLRCAEDEGRYLTIDRWESRSALETFRSRYATEYEALDKRLEGLAAAETRVGAFVGGEAASARSADGRGSS